LIPGVLPRIRHQVKTTVSQTAHPSEQRESHWERHARQWRHVGPPLRPVTEDVRLMQGAVAQQRRKHAEPVFHALLLGVTPELASMRWPEDTCLLAVDRCEGMIARVWPRQGLPDMAWVVRGDWHRFPVRSATMDMVIGDGFFTPLAYPADYLSLGAQIRRLLRPGGSYVIRPFVRPQDAENVTTISDDLWSGKIGNFHVFKLRLAMALHGSPDQGVRLRDIWTTWNRLVPDPDALIRRLGWPRDEIATINAYRDVDTRYTFPTLAELRQVLANHFVELECHIPGYELGERCPMMLLSTA
jgi:Methyltransferase domain